MSAYDTMRQISRMLPDAQRERFLLMCSRFRTVPEDDEYLMILEAIGLMTLLWKEVPEQIAKILENASPVEPSHQLLEKVVRESISEAVPSYEDLKNVAEVLASHETSLKRLLNSSPQADKNLQPSIGRLGWFLAGFGTNFLVGYLLYQFS